VNRFKEINDVRAACVAADSTTIDSKNEGKLLFVSGQVHSQEKVSDSTFGLNNLNALRLKRSVEMYQWVETSSSQEQKNYGLSFTVLLFFFSFVSNTEFFSFLFPSSSCRFNQVAAKPQLLVTIIAKNIVQSC
jgi:hypothetical protein